MKAAVAAIARSTIALAMAATLMPALTHAQITTTASIQSPPGTVTLPLAEYNRLLDRSRAAPAGREDPPVPAVISRAEIDLRVTGRLARATIGLQGEVFRSGATDVSLLSGGTLIAAELADRPTVPLVFASGGYRAILPGGQPFALTLTWGTPTLAEPGRAVLLLPAVQAGSVRASIDLPGEIADVRIAPGAITSRSLANGRTRVEVTLDPGTAARVTWSSRETTETAVRRELRLLSDVKTLVTMGEADVRMVGLFDVTVVQGEPARFDVRVPAGFEVTSVSGPTVEQSTTSDGVVALSVREPGRRRHQFLVAIERATAGGSGGTGAALPIAAMAAAPGGTGSVAAAPQSAGAAANVAMRGLALPWLDGVQRETGEVAVEGQGTLELTAAEKAPLHRIDASEVSAALQSLGRDAVLAAFRYQRRTPDAVTLDLSITRFPESAVLAAVAERAVVTTLVTRQGRALTEVALTVRNQGQPFMKVGLPQGATLLSAEVAGVAVKPVLGADGARVPLLRAGFRPSGVIYSVSFVYLESGAAYAKKGDAQLTLARLDLAVNLLEWELFLPEGFQVKRFEGDVLPRSLVEATLTSAGVPGGVIGGVVGGIAGGVPGGAVADAVTIVPKETLRVAGRVREQEAPPPPPPARQSSANEPQVSQQEASAPSVNVQNLQRRVAGVLPVRIDVPRAGHSHLFVRPIVIDEATTVRFSYRARS